MAPRHVHYSSDELFYVLEGRVSISGRGAPRKSVGWDVGLCPSGNGPRLQGHWDRAARKVAFGFHPWGPGGGGFEEFVKLRPEGEEVNRSARRSRTVAQMNKMFAELKEKYDSEFVGPPL